MEAGMIPSISADTLLMYAYAQKGVEHVELKFDVVKEKVEYSVRLDPTSRLKWLAAEKAKTIKNSIMQKAALLALRKAGAPLNIESSIKILARAYLPEKYSVEVKIVE